MNDRTFYGLTVIFSLLVAPYVAFIWLFVF